MLFSAEIADYKIVYSVLRSILFREYAVLRPMEEGLKFTLDEMKSVETSIYIPSTMFLNYIVNDKEDFKFKINLKLFTECLNIFGDESNPSLKLNYESFGSPLCLILNHNQENITVDCKIRTLNVDDVPDISLAEECNLNKIVINATVFAEILQRLDNSADQVKFTMTPDPPNFTLMATGSAGESELNISKNSDSVTLYECNEPLSATYSYNNIRQILKVMNCASKVAISTGESGLLGLQLVITSNEKQMYLEYYVMSQFGDE